MKRATACRCPPVRLVCLQAHVRVLYPLSREIHSVLPAFAGTHARGAGDDGRCQEHHAQAQREFRSIMVLSKRVFGEITGLGGKSGWFETGSRLTGRRC